MIWCDHRLSNASTAGSSHSFSRLPSGAAEREPLFCPLPDLSLEVCLRILTGPWDHRTAGAPGHCRTQMSWQIGYFLWIVLSPCHFIPSSVSPVRVGAGAGAGETTFFHYISGLCAFACAYIHIITVRFKRIARHTNPHGQHYQILTKSLENPDDRIKLLNVLLGNSKGCCVANLSGKSVKKNKNSSSIRIGLMFCYISVWITYHPTEWLLTAEISNWLVSCLSEK